MRMPIAKLLCATFLLLVFTGCNDNDDSTSPTKGFLPNVTNYPIVSTNQTSFYNNNSTISEPAEAEAFYGQDAHYTHNETKYVDHRDGTVSDMITGLMWETSFSYVDWADAEANAAVATTGGYSDWRVPTIKELYSLVDFTGNQGTGNPSSTTVPADAKPFIDTDYFEFSYPSDGSSRYIDVQFISKTTYSATALNNTKTFFGLN